MSKKLIKNKSIRFVVSFLAFLLILLLLSRMYLQNANLRPVSNPVWENESLDVPLRPIFKFTFHGEINIKDIESFWFISPEKDGKWNWLDERQAVWIAESPFDQKTEIIFGFNPNNVDTDLGFSNPVSWKTTTRSPRLLIGKPDPSNSLLTTIELGSFDSETPLAAFSGELLEISASPDGIWIFYVIRNSAGTVEIGRIRSDGNGNKLLFNCGNYFCGNLTPSTFLEKLYFVKGKDPSINSDEIVFDGLYALDLPSGAENLIYQHLPVEEFDFSISPDERWLSVYLGEDKGFEIWDMFSNSMIEVDEASRNAGSWSMDNRLFFYQKTIRENIFLRHQIAYLDLETRESSVITGENADSRSHHYFQPILNPVLKHMAVTTQSNLNLPGRELWVISNQGDVIKKISIDLMRIINGYVWSPDGRYLLFRYRDFPLEGEAVIFGVSDLNEAPRFFEAESQILVTWLP